MWNMSWMEPAHNRSLPLAKNVYTPEDLESQGLKFHVPIWNGPACKEKRVLVPCGSVLGSTECICFVSEVDKLLFNILVIPLLRNTERDDVGFGLPSNEIPV